MTLQKQLEYIHWGFLVDTQWVEDRLKVSLGRVLPPNLHTPWVNNSIATMNNLLRTIHNAGNEREVYVLIISDCMLNTMLLDIFRKPYF